MVDPPRSCVRHKNYSSNFCNLSPGHHHELKIDSAAEDTLGFIPLVYRQALSLLLFLGLLASTKVQNLYFLFHVILACKSAAY